MVVGSIIDVVVFDVDVVVFRGVDDGVVVVVVVDSAAKDTPVRRRIQKRKVQKTLRNLTR